MRVYFPIGWCDGRQMASSTTSPTLAADQATNTSYDFIGDDQAVYDTVNTTASAVDVKKPLARRAETTVTNVSAQPSGEHTVRGDWLSTDLRHKGHARAFVTSPDSSAYRDNVTLTYDEAATSTEMTSRVGESRDQHSGAGTSRVTVDRVTPPELQYPGRCRSQSAYNVILLIISPLFRRYTHK